MREQVKGQVLHLLQLQEKVLGRFGLEGKSEARKCGVSLQEVGKGGD